MHRVIIFSYGRTATQWIHLLLNTIPGVECHHGCIVHTPNHADWDGYFDQFEGRAETLVNIHGLDLDPVVFPDSLPRPKGDYSVCQITRNPRERVASFIAKLTRDGFGANNDLDHPKKVVKNALTHWRASCEGLMEPRHVDDVFAYYAMALIFPRETAYLGSGVQAFRYEDLVLPGGMDALIQLVTKGAVTLEDIDYTPFDSTDRTLDEWQLSALGKLLDFYRLVPIYSKLGYEL